LGFGQDVSAWDERLGKKEGGFRRFFFGMGLPLVGRESAQGETRGYRDVLQEETRKGHDLRGEGGKPPVGGNLVNTRSRKKAGPRKLWGAQEVGTHRGRRERNG